MYRQAKQLPRQACPRYVNRSCTIPIIPDHPVVVSVVIDTERVLHVVGVVGRWGLGEHIHIAVVVLQLESSHRTWRGVERSQVSMIAEIFSN